MTPDDLFHLADQSLAMRKNAQRLLDRSAGRAALVPKIAAARSATWRSKNKLSRMVPIQDGFENAMLELKWAMDGLQDLLDKPASHRSKDETLLTRMTRWLRS